MLLSYTVVFTYLANIAVFLLAFSLFLVVSRVSRRRDEQPPFCLSQFFSRFRVSHFGLLARSDYFTSTLRDNKSSPMQLSLISKNIIGDTSTILLVLNFTFSEQEYSFPVNVSWSTVILIWIFHTYMHHTRACVYTCIYIHIARG